MLIHARPCMSEELTLRPELEAPLTLLLDDALQVPVHEEGCVRARLLPSYLHSPWYRVKRHNFEKTTERNNTYL